MGSVPKKDMQTPPHSPHRSGQIFMKNAQYADKNEKNKRKILWFLFFELSWNLSSSKKKLEKKVIFF